MKPKRVVVSTAPYSLPKTNVYKVEVKPYNTSQSMVPSHVDTKNKKSPTPIKQKRGLSVKQLLDFTPGYVKAKARDSETTIVAYKKGLKKGFGAVSATCVSLENNTRRKHKVLVLNNVEDNPNGKIYRALKVKVQCSCESYVMGYGFEYANWAHGAADIIYGNGEPPRVTNFSLAPGLCKHAYVVLRSIQRNKD